MQIMKIEHVIKTLRENSSPRQNTDPCEVVRRPHAPSLPLVQDILLHLDSQWTDVTCRVTQLHNMCYIT